MRGNMASSLLAHGRAYSRFFLTWHGSVKVKQWVECDRELSCFVLTPELSLQPS